MLLIDLSTYAMSVIRDVALERVITVRRVWASRYDDPPFRTPSVRRRFHRRELRGDRPATSMRDRSMRKVLFTAIRSSTDTAHVCATSWSIVANRQAAARRSQIPIVISLG